MEKINMKKMVADPRAGPYLAAAAQAQELPSAIILKAFELSVLPQGFD
jgi:hypothetical protein